MSFFERMTLAVLFAVQQVDHNAAIPETTAQMAVYHQIPDGLYISYPGAPPQLHLEVKSWSAFLQHAENILCLAHERPVLILNQSETDHRAIIFKVSYGSANIFVSYDCIDRNIDALPTMQDSLCYTFWRRSLHGLHALPDP